MNIRARNESVVTRRPKWGALLLSVVLVVAACGTNQGGAGSPAAGTPAGGTPAGGTPAGESPAMGSPAGESPAGAAPPGEIAVWAMGNEGVLLGDFVQSYTEENADASVEVEPVDWGIARDRLLTAIGGGQTPDASQMGTDMMGEFIETGALEPLPGGVDTSRFFEGAFQSGVAPDGSAYSVPWYVETRVLYYRTDIAEEAGITEAPATWDDLKAMAQALQQEGGAEWGISLGTKNSQEYLPFVWSNGGDVMAEDGTFALNSPEAVEALEFYDSFFEEGLSPTQVPEGFDITPAFVQGTHPMFFSGPWHIGLLDDAGGEGFEEQYAVVPVPAPEGGTGTSFIGGGNFVVYTDSENKELAWHFVDWLTRPETQVAWYEEATVLPSDRSAWENPTIADDERVAVFGQQLESAKAPPAIPTWAEVANAINTQLERVTAGDEAAQAGADAMQQEAESVGTGG